MTCQPNNTPEPIADKPTVELEMSGHSFSVEWRFVVPPENDARIVIMQRKDGPFRKDAVGGAGHYYSSSEELVRGRWQHVSGSTTGGHASFEIAYNAAERLWQKTRRGL